MAFINLQPLLGILLASFGVTFFAFQGSIETSWRILYYLGGITGGIGLLMRFFSVEEKQTFNKKPLPILPLLWKYRFQFLVITITSGFSYANYYMITSLLNGYLPMISSISEGEAMKANTSILIFDFFLLPLAGFIATRTSKDKMLIVCSLLITLLAIPFYSLFATQSLTIVLAIRLFFVVLGVGFSVALAPFYQDLIPQESRYTLIALGNAIGSQLLGTSACAISFWLYQKTGWAPSPALYLMGLALLATTTVYLARPLLVPRCATNSV